MGEEMSKLNFHIDKIYCSAHKRAILSAKYFREGFNKYQNKDDF
jgi:phosphohistidine phosphatase SixA